MHIADYGKKFGYSDSISGYPLEKFFRVAGSWISP
jgi:hypothetical protein